MAKQQTNKQQVKATARQTGWGFVNITVSGTEQFADITFPTAFPSVPIVTATPLGWTTAGSVGGPNDFNGSYAASFGLSHHVVNITPTGFRILLRGGQAFGVSKSGFCWTAEV